MEVPPFTYCRVDTFGPFIIKQRRSEVKRYGAMFTCMNSRAVYVEVTHSLNTVSFIQALRRIIARRGNIRTIYSDNGNNFIRPQNELKRDRKNIETEGILNSRPLTVEKINDPTSELPLSPAKKILTMKSKVVMPPPGEF